MSGLPSPVRRVQVLANSEKPEVRELLGPLAEWLERRVDEVAVAEDLVAFCAEHDRVRSEGGEPPAPDLVVVLGGDGAMLAAAHAYREEPVPTLGINFGRVGFLAACAASHWEEVLAGILAGDGVLEPRMRLQIELERAGGRGLEATALNDVVVGRAAHHGLLSASLWVGDDWVTDVRADGIVVATPSGSTAYSLAAGGPVLAPSMLGLVLTPVASQGLANRPIVLHPESEVRIEVTPGGSPAAVAVDGRGYYPMHPGERLVARRHPVPYSLFSMPGLDPYRRLRSRLGWGGQVGPGESPA